MEIKCYLTATNISLLSMQIRNTNDIYTDFSFLSLSLLNYRHKFFY